MLEVVFYAVIAIIAGLAALGRHFERRENTRARLLTSDGDPAWANAHKLSSSAGSQQWSGKVGPVPGAQLRATLTLDREANGRTGRLVSLEVTVEVSGARALPFTLESTRRASDTRDGHPTLSRWFQTDGDDQEVIASVNSRFADGLVALKEGSPAWSAVSARASRMTCTYEADGVTEEELDALLSDMLGRVKACARAWPHQGPLMKCLDGILRDPSEPDSVRWRAVMYLLTRHAESDAARLAFEDRESWPDVVRTACLIWGGEAREFSQEERYVLLRDASREPDPELAEAAGRELSRSHPWRALNDARAGLEARVLCAPLATSDPELPERERVVDDALVGVLTGMLPDESARARLHAGIMEGGWAPSAAARLKLVERGTPELNAAIMEHVEAVGATEDDTQALEALRADGFDARVDAVLERAHDARGAGGMLTVTDPRDQGALTQAGADGGELSHADPE